MEADLGRFGKVVAISLACVPLAGCAANDREAQCREKGIVPGTVEMAACMEPEKAEALRDAKSSWQNLERGVRR